MLSASAVMQTKINNVTDQAVRRTTKGVLYFFVCAEFTALLSVTSIFFGIMAYLEHDEMPNRYSFVGVLTYALAIAPYYIYCRINDAVKNSDLKLWARHQRGALSAALGLFMFLGTIPILYAVIPFMS
jgi:hypothetical protein